MSNHRALLCTNCEEHFDTSQYKPYIPGCGHNICSSCINDNPKDSLDCRQCSEKIFNNDVKENDVAMALLYEMEDLSGLCQTIQEMENLKMQEKSSVAPVVQPVVVPPIPDFPQIPDLGAPPPSYLAAIQPSSSKNINKMPTIKNNRQQAPPSNRMKPRAPLGYQNRITIKNISPQWNIPDINERFGIFGTILRRFPCKINERIESIDLVYKYKEEVLSAVHCMDGVDNECGGKLSVFENPYGNNQKMRDFLRERTIIVRNLGPTVDEDQLREIFKNEGHIINCVRKLDAQGKLNGTAWIEYATPESAQKALEKHYEVPRTRVKLTTEEFYQN